MNSVLKLRNMKEKVQKKVSKKVVKKNKKITESVKAKDTKKVSVPVEVCEKELKVP